MAMPVKKPVITALETKRVSRPSLRTPMTTMNAPVRIASIIIAPATASLLMPASALAVISIIAAVRLTFMNCELVSRPATGMPTIIAFMP